MQPQRKSARFVVEFVITVFISLILFSWGFRFVSMPFLLWWIYACWNTSSPRYSRRVVWAWLGFFGSLLIPVDIDIGGMHGSREGVSSGGVHLVRLVKGMPMHTRLIERYGEYVSGGCVSHGFEPIWILVWN